MKGLSASCSTLNEEQSWWREDFYGDVGTRGAVETKVNFPGLTSKAFLRMRTLFVRKVPPASSPRKHVLSNVEGREPSWGLATFSSFKKLPVPFPTGPPLPASA